MKPVTIVAVAVLIILAVFYFTKPSDAVCRDAALKIVSVDIVKIPGYSDPNANNALPSVSQPEKVLISDRFLWKDISYVYPSTVKKIGKAYLGSFHATETTK